MAWDFSTDPAFQAELEWMDSFVRAEIEPLDALWGDLAYVPLDARLRMIVDPLKDQVRARGLWACHLGPELGGQGFGQLKLGLMNEILGRSSWAPIVFGTQAPDTGNAEIIAHYGTDDQKRRYLQPLLDGEIFSCYSMTEPQGGSDPSLFRTRAVRDGDEWVITGEKFFSSNFSSAAFVIVMVITDPDVPVYQGSSMFLVPTDTPGLDVVRYLGTGDEPIGTGMHAYMRYNDVRVPADNLLGGEGQGFAIAQTRLGGGRIHHAMRTVAQCRQAFDMLCERALSRETRTGILGDKQFVQGYIADSYAEIEQFRLFVLYTAWLIDQKTTAGARKEIAAAKYTAAKVLHDVVQRAVQVHGALGVSNEMPLSRLWQIAAMQGVMDGPNEVHKVTVARQILKDCRPAPDEWPSRHLPRTIAAAQAKFADLLEHDVGNL
ncbi:MAG: acyl-CoA dehydrogenase family protein [Acidimicrobiia bacterium]